MDNELLLIEKLIPIVKDAYSAGGWLAVLPVALPSVVQIFKSPSIQGLLPEQMKFANLKPGAQFGVAFLVAAIPVFLVKVSSGGVIAAAILAVSSGIAATLSYAKLLKPAGQSETASKVAAALPKTMANSMGLIVKLDQARIDELVKIAQEKNALKKANNGVN